MTRTNVILAVAPFAFVLLWLGYDAGKAPTAAAQATARPSARVTRTEHVVLSTARTADLVKIGQAQTDVLDGDMLSGYVMATFDQMSIDGRICPSAGTDTAQVLAIGKNAIMNAHDEHPALPLRVVLSKAYPCST